jgi:hypothetical protein
MAFQVTLSSASTKTVTVEYTTSDGTANAPSDYVATSGTLTFAPGETTKTIDVPVVGDLTIEPDETFTATLSNPVNATIAVDNGTGTIHNDDVPRPGLYQGATQEGNYVYFTVTPNKTITQFRTNSLTEDCGGGEYLQGSVNWGSQEFPIAADGSFIYQGTWTGTQTYGSVTYTSESWKLTGQFSATTSVTGTIALSDQLTDSGTAFSCSGSVTFSATFQG